MQIATAEELVKAHEIFERKESRCEAYWTAVTGVENGLHTQNFGDVASSVAEFLKSWNRNYYRFRPSDVSLVQREVQQLLTQHLETIKGFRARSLATLTESDRPNVLRLFGSFEQKLGAVGAAKALNPLAHTFFPLWDNAIAYGYGVVAAPHGYFLFMALVKDQLLRITGLPDELMPLKTLDEYNYCNFTKNWLS